MTRRARTFHAGPRVVQTPACVTKHTRLDIGGRSRAEACEKDSRRTPKDARTTARNFSKRRRARDFVSPLALVTTILGFWSRDRRETPTETDGQSTKPRPSTPESRPTDDESYASRLKSYPRTYTSAASAFSILSSASLSVSSLAAYEIRRHSGLPNALPGTSAT